MRHLPLRSALVLLASLFTACSSFDRHWKEAARGAGHATRWDGHWESKKIAYANGVYHHGRLRCVLLPQPDKSLKAYFHANWLMFSGNYDITLRPKPAASRSPAVQGYEGTHDLPVIFGGTYHYQATIAGNHFAADYSCRIDHGIFDLWLVPPAKESAESNAQH